MQNLEIPSLAGLDDSSKFTGPVDIANESTPWLKSALRSMILIRACEERIADMVTEGKVVCPAHLAIGQEGVAVGVARGLRNTDRAFGTHRSHSHYVAMGGSVDQLFAEVLGKKSGCSGGMGGSMHLYARDKGFSGSVPIVGATISMAVGAALAAKMDGNRSGKGLDVGVTFFGDGATEEGTFHESMNYAENFKLPALFVCENNLFSSHLHVKLRQPANCISRFAQANCMPYEIVDGNDVVAVAKATDRLLKRARSGAGPGFLEAVTYRWRGHVGPREDIDVGVQRSQVDVSEWKKRDPVDRLKRSMLEIGALSEGEFATMVDDVYAQVAASAQKAVAAPYPDIKDLLGLVYPKRKDA